MSGEKISTKGQLRILTMFLGSAFLLALPMLTPSVAKSEERYASNERSTVARAHMSRARALMVEALTEFEEARKFARPDLLIDSESWRLSLVSLTEQLNRVIDPKPRITREGAVFRAPPRLIRREKDRLPAVADGAKSRSDHGEQARMREKQLERARLFGGVEEEVEEAPPTRSRRGKKAEVPKAVIAPSTDEALEESAEEELVEGQEQADPQSSLAPDAAPLSPNAEQSGEGQPEGEPAKLLNQEQVPGAVEGQDGEISEGEELRRAPGLSPERSAENSSNPQEAPAVADEGNKLNQDEEMAKKVEESVRARLKQVVDSPEPSQDVTSGAVSLSREPEPVLNQNENDLEEDEE